MTGGPGSTERHYRRLLDKLKARSNRIFVKAQMQNRNQEQRLKTVIDTLKKDRDLSIRTAHEGIWKVTSKECPMPRLAKPEGLPSYLARPKATTLPTPAELASLLPKKRMLNRPPHVSQAPSVVSKPPPRQYTKISKRRLSTMTSDDVQIWHYRKVLTDLEGAGEVFQEADENDEETNAVSGSGEKNKTTGDGDGPDTKWASPVDKAKSVISETGKMSIADSSAAAEESVRMVMRKLGIRPQSSPLTRPSHGPRQRKKRPQTSAGVCATIAEQKIDSDSKTLRINYLDMYRTQMKKHVRRMSTKGVMPAPTVRIDSALPQHQDEQSKPGLEKTVSSRTSTPSKVSQTQSKFSSPTFTLESRGLTSPVKKERVSTLMQQTASSTSRSSPRLRMRRVSTQVKNATAFQELHGEVQQMQSYRKFRRESLQVADIANLDDVEDGELFEEMRHCRYIRWGKEDEAIIEEMIENEPLHDQLALLTLKYTPETKSKKKSRVEKT